MIFSIGAGIISTILLAIFFSFSKSSITTTDEVFRKFYEREFRELLDKEAEKELAR